MGYEDAPGFIGPQPEPHYGPDPKPPAGPRTPLGEETCEAHPENDVCRPVDRRKPALTQLVDYQDAPRMSVASRSYDAGALDVGAHENFEVPAPGNADPANRIAMMSASVTKGGSTFSVGSTITAIAPGTVASKPFSLTFAPHLTGPLSGELTVYMKWSDGHSERATITLTGYGRAADRPTTHSRPPVLPASQPPDNGETSDDAYPQRAKSALDLAHQYAAHRVGELGVDLAAAVNSVGGEALSYVKAAEHRPIWQDLVEFAVTIASAGIAGILGKKLEALLKEIGSTSEVADGGQELVTRTVDPEIGAYSIKGAEKTFEAGIKETSKKVTAMAMDRAQRIATPFDSEVRLSDDVLVEFFNCQQVGVAEFSRSLADTVSNVNYALLPTLRTPNSHLAVDAMNALATTIDSSKGPASKTQAQTTAASWGKLRARMGVGTAEIREGGESRMIANLDEHTRNRKTESVLGEDALDHFRGLLDIYVSRDQWNGSGSISVTGARWDGMAASTLTTIEGMNLVAANLPLRLIVDNSVVITVDEVGRVRLSGALGNLDPQSAGEPGEASSLRGARLIVKQVLSKPLAEWGIQIEGDDGSGRVQAGS